MKTQMKKQKKDEDISTPRKISQKED